MSTDPSSSRAPLREPSATDAPRWPVPPTAPEGAPNVVVIMTDDVGYGASSTFGGPIPTPTFDSLADRGLRYSRFHTTAMCSPTRAALMTGRNHHRVGSGRVTEMAVAYDGYTSVIPDDAATVAEILRLNGYNTAHFGKYHNVPAFETGPSGPFDHWPTNMGFEYFYGFLGGSTNNWAPSLHLNTTPIEPPTDDPTYHVESDLADRAIEWIRQQTSTSPDAPFFIQYATAACHTPHHAPTEWISRFSGWFDRGWDVVREETLTRQKALGVVPDGTELTQRPPEIAAWDSLSADQQKVAARMMEVYAASLAYADAQVGRVLDELGRIGELDNTLVIYIQGDNGSSPEGGANGMLNEMSYVNRMEDSIATLLERLDELGGPLHYNGFPAGWAHATDSPFKWFKMIASHFGGSRNGMTLTLPSRIHDTGGVRTQFHHVIDIAPTILDVAGIDPPSVVNNVPQSPMDGVPMTYTFDNPEHPSTRTTQYFEIMGNFAIYHDGWVAATTPVEMPWEYSTEVCPVDARQWELYDIAEDYSQAHDLAAAHPDRLRSLIELFWTVAEDNQVLPIITGKAYRPGPPKPDPTDDRSTFTYYPGTPRLAPGVVPDITNRSFTITAEVVLGADRTNGVILAQGGRFGGHALYFLDGHVVYHYNLLDRERYTVTSESPVGPGAHVIAARLDLHAHDRGSSATVTVLCDGRPIGRGEIDNTAPWRVNYIEGLSIGRDAGTPTSEDYQIPFQLDETLHHVRLELD